MGIVRLMLSVSIVAFHTSAVLGHIGYSAVFGFYVMSGYVISLVIEKTYTNHSGKFWANRLLKIFPTYWIVLLASGILISKYGNSVVVDMQTGGADKLFVAALSQYSIGDICNEIILGYLAPKNGIKSYFFTGFPTIVPQAWTNTIELFYYATAPFGVMLWKRNKRTYYLLFIIVLAYPVVTFIFGLEFVIYRYRTVMGAYCFFMIGSLIYFNREKFPELKHPYISFGLLNTIYILMFCVGKNKDVFSEARIWLSTLVMIFMIIVSSKITGNNIYKRIDKICSILSAGVYLTHMLARALILLLVSELRIDSKIVGYGTDYFAISVLLLSLILAWLLYLLVDKPLEVVRNKVRP